MTSRDDAAGSIDTYDLKRFITAQEGVYPRVLAELKNGLKQSHWMWFIFPQIEGLGHSPTSVYYSVKSLDEARAFLHHPILGARLLECSEAVLAVKGRNAAQIFAYPDDMKLKSSMTLFAAVADDAGSIFVRVLERYFQGDQDARTLQLLKAFRDS